MNGLIDSVSPISGEFEDQLVEALKTKDSRKKIRDCEEFIS
jgi:hypothetical protein